MKPQVFSINPNVGPSLGGHVRIYGHGFIDATQVLFARISVAGGSEHAPRSFIPASSFTVIDDQRIEAFTPPHEPALVDVIVIGPDGESAQVPEDRFVFTVEPDPEPEPEPEPEKPHHHWWKRWWRRIWWWRHR